MNHNNNTKNNNDCTILTHDHLHPQVYSHQHVKNLISTQFDNTSITVNDSNSIIEHVKNDYEKQILHLKDKAHKSFMQVMYLILFIIFDRQIQQLHDEQIQMIKEQYEHQLLLLKQEQEKLLILNQKSLETLRLMQKNTKYHTYQLQQPSLIIQNIEIIQCKQIQDNYQTQNAKNILTHNLSQNILMNEQSINQLNGLMNEDPQDSLMECKHKNKFQEVILQLNQQLGQLHSENHTILQLNEQLKKDCFNFENNYQSIKNNYDSLEKQCKFMTEHIRNLSTDKLKLQKRIKQLQKQNRQIKKLISTYELNLNEERKKNTQQYAWNYSQHVHNNNKNISANNYNNYSSMKIKVNNTNINQQFEDIETLLINNKNKEFSNNNFLGVNNFRSQSSIFEDELYERDQRVEGSVQEGSSVILDSMTQSIILQSDDTSNFNVNTNSLVYTQKQLTRNKIEPQQLVSFFKGVFSRKSLPKHKLISQVSSLNKRNMQNTQHIEKYSPMSKKKDQERASEYSYAKKSNELNQDSYDNLRLIRQIHDELLQKQRFLNVKKGMDRVSKSFGRDAWRKKQQYLEKSYNRQN